MVHKRDVLHLWFMDLLLIFCRLYLQILLKLDKSKEDKAAESKRTELLKFLNASYD